MSDPEGFVADDLVRVWHDKNGSGSDENLLVQLYFGDDILEAKADGDHTRVLLVGNRYGWVKGKLSLSKRPPLALAFIDVGQGDACLMTTPNGRTVLVDGGENQMAARYLAARFWHRTLSGSTVDLDAIVVTHGDADHFSGLSELVLDASKETRDRKRIRVAAQRVFHNGIVKRPATDSAGQPRKDSELLGPLIEMGGKRLLTSLVEDPRSLGPDDLNLPFRRWKDALVELAARNPKMRVSRLDCNIGSPFDFLGDVQATVLGPRPIVVPSGGPALPHLGSAAETINGHSITLSLKYGNVGFLLTGDLNETTERELLALHTAGKIDLRAEVLKVPHHGSDDFMPEFFHAVRPLVSVISAGDEDARRDYLHPRANVLGALGNAGRGIDPLILVTNLSAFDRWAGRAFRAVETAPDKWEPDTKGGTFYARERTRHGIVHVRTDGSRLFVSRPGARPSRHEAYAFVIAADGKATRQTLRVV